MDFRDVYTLQHLTDTFALISDNNDGLSVTNAAIHVVADLHERIDGGLGTRRVYYRDTTGRFDELKHEEGRFMGFAPCSEHQQAFLKELATETPLVKDWGAPSPFG